MPSKKDVERATGGDAEREFLGRRLKEARDYLGLSQDYVSQQTKIPRPAISEAEAGRRRVESLELKRLAALYGRPLSYFLSDQEGAGLASPESRDLPPDAVDQTDIKLRGLTKDLPAGDREEIVRFAEYLRHKKLTSQTVREPGEEKTP